MGNLVAQRAALVKALRTFRKQREKMIRRIRSMVMRYSRRRWLWKRDRNTWCPVTCLVQLGGVENPSKREYCHFLVAETLEPKCFAVVCGTYLFSLISDWCYLLQNPPRKMNGCTFLVWPHMRTTLSSYEPLKIFFATTLPLSLCCTHVVWGSYANKSEI